MQAGCGVFKQDTAPSPHLSRPNTLYAFAAHSTSAPGPMYHLQADHSSVSVERGDWGLVGRLWVLVRLDQNRLQQQLLVVEVSAFLQEGLPSQLGRPRGFRMHQPIRRSSYRRRQGARMGLVDRSLANIMSKCSNVPTLVRSAPGSRRPVNTVHYN